MQLGEALLHEVLEGDVLRADGIAGPEADDALPVFVGGLDGEVVS